MIKEHNQVVVLLMGVLDLAVTAGAWVFCYWVRFHSGYFAFEEPVAPGLEYIADIVVITLLLTLLIFARVGLYMPRRSQTIAREVLDIVKACMIVWAIEIVLGSFLHPARISLKLQFMFLAVWPVLMICYRGSARLVLRALRRRGRNIREVAIVGGGRLGQKLLHTLRKQPWTGYEVRYFVCDTRVGGELLGVPVMGPVGDIERIIEANPVDVVMIALPQASADQLTDVLNKLSTSLVDVNVIPDLLSYQFLRHQVRQLGSLPIVNLTHSPQSGWNAVFKRVLDIVVSLTLLAAIGWFMLLIGLLVKLTSPGPVFYIQRRASLGGREFNIIKFRSMVVAAEAANGAVWAVKDDPRATGLGRILRKYSLDELPQLLNVLRGDMSLVGPRPERPELIERFTRQIPRYTLRHHVKAGITGWAQVNGFRGMTSLRKRLQYDLDYINRWSFAFDLYVLVLTVFRGFIPPRA